ncbi:MAG TPA: toll/interleukin-1 receptor domain-containing protein [Pyrinomonadaceae bacterium]
MSTDEYDIFINHNSQDKKFIVPILERLNAEYDIRTWLDQWDLYAARDWETVIEGALKTCLSCAVFLGEHGWGEHHRAETDIALRRQTQHPEFKVIPIMLPGALNEIAVFREEDITVVDGLFTRQHRVDFTTGLEDEEAFRRLLAAIRGKAPGPPRITVFTIKRDATHWKELPRTDKNSVLSRCGIAQS